MSTDMFLESLAHVLSRTGEMSNREVAEALGALGVPVLPTVPGGKDPMLSADHIRGVSDATGEVTTPPCAACNAAGLRPTKDHGATVDAEVIGRYWSAHPDAGVGMKDHPQIVRGDGDFADGQELRKARKAIGYGEPFGEPMPCEAPTPGGQYRRRYIHWLPDDVPAPGGGTKLLGVSWYGASGYTVVKGGHPRGGEYAPFHGKITPLPEKVSIALRLRGTTSTTPGADAASSEELTAFHAQHTGTERLDRLARIRKQVATAGEGDRHHQAAAALVVGYREAIAGYYPAGLVDRAVHEALDVAGWEQARFDAEWDELRRWALGQVKNLTPAEAREHVAKAESDWRQQQVEARFDEREFEHLEDSYSRDLTDDEIDRLAELEAAWNRTTAPNNTSDAVGDEEGGPWAEVDLMPAWTGERPEPVALVLARSDGTRLLMPGINYLFGDSGDGKSWVALFASLEQMRAGRHVVWVTYEDPNEIEVVKRLRALGATRDDLRHLSLIVASEAMTAGVGFLARLVRRRQTALLVLDSVGEALAVDGVDEDRDTEFGQWARSTVRLLIDVAAKADWDNAEGTPPNADVAVLPIDHSTKAKDNPFYPSGTKRKRAMITGAMFMLNVRDAFGIGRRGRVQLIAAKDRSGRFVRGEIAAEVVLDATVEPYELTIDPPPTGAEMAGAGKKRKADERVLQALEQSNAPLTAEEVGRIVNRQENRLIGEGELSMGSIKNAMTRLARRPNVSCKAEPTGVGKGYRNVYTVTNHESDATAGVSNA